MMQQLSPWRTGRVQGSAPAGGRLARAELSAGPHVSCARVFQLEQPIVNDSSKNELVTLETELITTQVVEPTTIPEYGNT